MIYFFHGMPDFSNFKYPDKVLVVPYTIISFWAWLHFWLLLLQILGFFQNLKIPRAEILKFLVLFLSLFSYVLIWISSFSLCLCSFSWFLCSSISTLKSCYPNYPNFKVKLSKLMAEFLCYCWFCGRDSVGSSTVWHGHPSHSGSWWSQCRCHGRWQIPYKSLLRISVHIHDYFCCSNHSPVSLF